MKSKDFVEVEEGKFVMQLGSFWKGLVQYGTMLGFSPADIDDAEKDYRWMEYAVFRNDQVQSYAQGYTAFKKDLRHGANKPMPESTLSASSISPPPTPVNGNIEKRFRKRVRRVKSHISYSDSIGELMRIVAPRQEFDKDKAKPKFKIVIDGGRPHIKFKKKHFDAFEIWKDTGAGFQKMDRVMHSPYVDESPLPTQGASAVWKYRLIGIVSDKPIGQVSDTVIALVYG